MLKTFNLLLQSATQGHNNKMTDKCPFQLKLPAEPKCVGTYPHKDLHTGPFTTA